LIRLPFLSAEANAQEDSLLLYFGQAKESREWIVERRLFIAFANGMFKATPLVCKTSRTSLGNGIQRTAEIFPGQQ
jgi:hypothetical protein